MRFRKERVAGAIREIVSDAIARKINDPRLAPLTTVSRVTVSGDLTIATVFFTVVGDEVVERRSLAALQHARGFIQHLVAQEIDMRQSPELRFELDDVAKKVRETMLLLDENRLREPHLYQTTADTTTSGGDEEPEIDEATSVEREEEEGMKDGTRYADRLKKAYAKVKHGITEADIPELRDPIRCLALGILGSDNGPDRAERQLNKALGLVVDWNEIRVSNVHEVAELLGDTGAESLRRCQNLLDALHAIYDRENKVSLDRLKSLGRREARQYLETLKGVDEYAVAYVVLWSLGGHAIPVWNQVLSALCESDLVHPAATRAEIQAFLERNISAADAKAFSLAVPSLGTGKKVSTKKSSSPKSRKREAAK